MSTCGFARALGTPTNAVATCRQAWRGADGCCAVGRVRRVVVADRAVAAEGRAALPLSGPEAAAGSAGAAGDFVRALHRDRVAASACRAGLRRRLDMSPAHG